MSQWPHQSEVDSFYGNPRGVNGDEDAAWVKKNIIRVPAPWQLVTAWDFQPVSGIRVHRKCAESLAKVLQQIWTSAGQRQQKIQEWGMHLYAGGFNYRPMRNGTKLSMHSWGCAVDFDSARNGLGDSTPNFATLPQVLEAFASEGWTWGGRWNKPDGMHWQAADI